VKLIETKGTVPIVFGELHSSPRAKTILFYNHYDVQPPDPLENWKSDPFKAEVRGEKIYARGAADNKGDIVARINAVKAVREVRGKIPVNVKFLVEGEEEVGSRHLRVFAKRNRRLIKADGCVWEWGSRDVSGRPHLYFGMKGILHVRLDVRTAAADQHSMWAPIVTNAAWQLTRALGALKSDHERILIKGWYDDVREPDRRDMLALKRMAFGEEAYRKAFGIKRFLGRLGGVKLRKSLVFDPTCTICGMKSGYLGEGGKTVNPSKASVNIDFRLVPDQDPIYLLKKLKQHLKVKGFGDVKVTMLNAERPCKTSLDSKISSIAVKAAEATYQCEPSVWPILPGSGPMALFVKDLGIPTVCTGVGYYNAREHAPNENIRVEDLLLGIEYIARIIESF